MRRTVAIIGGGISGLAAAHHLTEISPDTRILVLEAGRRLGGVLRTDQQDGFLIESAADSFLTVPPAAVELCQRLDLAEQLIEPNQKFRRSLVVHRGRLEQIPEGFMMMAPTRLKPLLRTPILSLRGKLRAACEYFVAPRNRPEDESLESFVCRRFGRELFERLVQPLVGGIYAADARQLSVAATMPRFLQMEREHGSLLRALLRSRPPQSAQAGSGARYGQFTTFRRGMSTLVDALANRLPFGATQLNSPVDRLVATAEERWRLDVGGDRPRTLVVDGVVLALPAHRIAPLLHPVDTTSANEFTQIPYSSCAVVSLGYRREQVDHPLDGFGFVVPLVEERLILSCSFSSIKFPGRAPQGTTLLRTFIGGACQSGLLELPTRQLVQLAERELGKLLGIHGEPLLRHVVRHNRATPQYHVGHADRVARIAARLRRFPTLAIASNALQGLGVPSCIQGAQAAAEQIVSGLVAPADSCSHFNLTH